MECQLDVLPSIRAADHPTQIRTVATLSAGYCDAKRGLPWRANAQTLGTVPCSSRCSCNSDGSLPECDRYCTYRHKRKCRLRTHPGRGIQLLHELHQTATGQL